jgi:hypothetical protein
MTGMQITSSEYFPRQSKRATQKNGCWEFILLFQLLRFCGRRLDDLWGEGVASLETGLRGEASGAKIDVGQNLVGSGGG